MFALMAILAFSFSACNDENKVKLDTYKVSIRKLSKVNSDYYVNELKSFNINITKDAPLIAVAKAVAMTQKSTIRCLCKQKTYTTFTQQSFKLENGNDFVVVQNTGPIRFNPGYVIVWINN
jgi:outer membrane lipoprotein SlyB